MSESQKPVCTVCIRIRWFLLIAAPIILLMGTQADIEPPAIQLHELVAKGIMFMLAAVLAWRIYEYQQEKKAIARLLERKSFEQKNEDS